MSGVDERVDSGDALGQVEGMVCGRVEGGVVQPSAGEPVVEQGGVHPIPVASLVAFGQRVDPLGGDTRPVGSEEEPDRVLHVVVTEDQRPPCPHGVGRGVPGEQGHGCGDPGEFGGTVVVGARAQPGCEVTIGVGHRSPWDHSWVVSDAALPRVRRGGHRYRRDVRAGCWRCGGAGTRIRRGRGGTVPA